MIKEVANGHLFFFYGVNFFFFKQISLYFLPYINWLGQFCSIIISKSPEPKNRYANC